MSNTKIVCQEIRKIDTNSPNPVRSICLSKTGKNIIFTNGSTYICEYDLSTSKFVNSFETKEQPDNIQLSGDGKHIVSNSFGSINIYKYINGTHVRGIDAKSSTIALSPDSNYIISGSASGQINIYHISSVKPAKIIDAHTKKIYSIQISADGKHIISAAENIKIHDFSTGKCIRTIDSAETFKKIIISPDQKNIIALSDNRYVYIYDLLTGQQTGVIDINNRYNLYNGYFIASITMSLDGKYIISGKSNLLQIHDISTGQCMKKIEYTNLHIGAITMSIDGKYIIVGLTNNRYDNKINNNIIIYELYGNEIIEPDMQNIPKFNIEIVDDDDDDDDPSTYRRKFAGRKV